MSEEQILEHKYFQMMASRNSFHESHSYEIHMGLCAPKWKNEMSTTLSVWQTIRRQKIKQDKDYN